MGLVKKAEKYNFAAMVMIGIIAYFFLDMMTTSASKTNVMNTVFDAAKQEGRLG